MGVDVEDVVEVGLTVVLLEEPPMLLRMLSHLLLG